MGYMRHHAIVVTSWNSDAIAKAHAEATRVFNVIAGLPGDDLAECVSPVVGSAVNGYRSFFIAPDGSKEGWATSDVGDGARAEFVAWLDAQQYEDRSAYLNWVEVQYGDEEGQTLIVNDSDALLRDPA